MNKILHGDSLEVLKTLEDESVDFICTDPPYLVEWQSNRRGVKHEKIINDNNSEWLNPISKELFRVLKKDSLMISFYGWPDAELFLSAWKSAGFVPKSHLVWVKNNIGLGWFSRGQHEPMYLLSKGKPHKPHKAISDVIYAIGTGNEFHPTQKPLELMQILINAFTQEGDIVLDPFSGSGTTALAAKILGRNYIGIEINEKYFHTSNARLAALNPTLI